MRVVASEFIARFRLLNTFIVKRRNLFFKIGNWNFRNSQIQYPQKFSANEPFNRLQYLRGNGIELSRIYVSLYRLMVILCLFKE